MATTPASTSEAVAQEEPASTSAGRWAERVLIPYFLLLIAVVPVIQVAVELARGERMQELEVFRQFPTLERLQLYERAVEDNSVVAEAVRKQCQWLGVVTLRVGNQKAVIGRGDAIFYRPSLDAVIGPHFMSDPHAEGHPVPAIVGFRDALRRQGVELVVVVVPGKETIYPEWLSTWYAVSAGPAQIPDMPAFLAEMKRKGVHVVDPTEALWRGRVDGEMYLRLDTHWTPAGLDVVADQLVSALPPVSGRRQPFRAEGVPVTRRGDLYDMLQLPAWSSPFRPQSVTVRRVVTSDTGEPVETDTGSPIVLLGDSFTNIYSVAEMGWGDHAGLGEQLALRLGRPVDIIAQNDGGVNTARATLARRPDGVAGKRVVIWQFAARDLVVSNGEWQRIGIGPREE